MPGPSAVSNLIEFFYRDGFSRIHEIQMEHSQKYGKIFKSRFGPQLVVSIAGRDLVRGNMESWKEYRDLRAICPDLSQEGEDWLKMRSILRQLIMRPKDVAQFSDDVNAVVEDLVKRVDTLRSQQSDGLTVLNINDLFSNTQWKVGMAAILYEDRLGCLENEIPQKSQDYIAALHLMFSSFKMTMYAGAIPKWLRTVVPRPWQEFCSSWDGLFSFSQIHVDKRLGEIQDLVSRGETVKGGLLTHMLVTREMNLEEIYANMTEMLLAGVDTTSFTLSWACYLLARHPEVQQEIYEEVTRTLGHGTIPTADDVPRLPLIRGLVKETLRMFPVLPGNGHSPHILPVSSPPQTQLALCHYSTSMDERISPGLMTSVQTAGSGRTLRTGWISRIAELEMHLALTQGGNHTHTHTHTHTTKTHGLLCPAAPINLQFADRQP
uniref:Uncharacterized protein n=1 Tax=Oncorhynchus tshawytscha TaxID=74940 RepID=A0AAZ3S6Q6_ONCTS